MGMDVSGKNPINKDGEYFRNNVWWWTPLAEYCQAVAPELCKKCGSWHTNDGCGLNAADSKKLADLLQEEVNAGRTAHEEIEYRTLQENTPDEPCKVCDGTGKRQVPPLTGAGDQPCNGCNSTGKVRPWSTQYPFSEENVKEFILFLRGCGGFEIW